jgi:LacI family transcriptional regulator
MSITSKELANMLGVSQATVSLAINGKPGINENTRKKILAAADKYKLKGSRPKTAGQKFIDLVCFKHHGQVLGETAFFSSVIEGISQQVSSSGYSLKISYLYYGEQNYNSDLKQLRMSDSSGMILLATEMQEENLVSFTGFRQPVVLLDSAFHSPDYNCVVINNQQGAYLATRYLLDHGHRRIGHLASSVRINNFTEREYGFLHACHEVPDCTFETYRVGSTQEQAYNDMAALLEKQPQLPTAFFADNDIIAISCIRALKDFHYRIPEDVSVIGFDDTPISYVVSPKLTTIHVYKEELGKRAVNLLTSLIADPDQTPVCLMLNVSLVERDSVRTL